ncbi:3-oxoacyl-[acyl-carrier-protein] reductase [Wickerhamomyces ciferrii]|uniref:3-oxoacyl-[acyl-carrier-protein] reductase n=1 Tax=Wickerhamomyces ciferrii (strain ATCC 14091 / BCRC 22168 / CBS 111 / JCM 3599 / NBRC 0793 / NRRL Y-1031 F-60-10) TaxID=1206466 RepID=K0KW77_WICCF|nr:3-oxoacyl-[acyl-carrier-protein] reductase [Wickerhamomyces ciferrii]CCH45398.1 3-oxoacyl-[acyl-carrier-protein] reductase [Wickerhamomyces ciferrii]
MFESLKGKTVLITGASSGIGEATAKTYAEVTNGEISLILLARRFDKLKEVQKYIKTKLPNTKIVVQSIDLSQTDLILQWGDSNQELINKLDILVNNAGFAHGLKNIGDIPHSDVTNMINTNLTGLITLTQIVVKSFKFRNTGDVVNISSISGKDPYIGGAIYCLTKTAISTFSDVLRKEFKDTNVRIIEILPGLVQTEFASVRHDGDSLKAEKVYQIYEPLSSKDIAEGIIWSTSRPPNVQVAELMLLPTHQASMRDADMQR